jgi:signal transduction histidine kinase
MESSETKTLTFSGKDLGDSVELVVEDTGVGMTDEVLERALEAFFSTKPSLNKRRGLGLNVAKRLLEISGGQLKIDSTPSLGTKVSLIFLKESHEERESRNGQNSPELEG